MSSPFAVVASRRLQAAVLAILCLAAVRLACAIAQAGGPSVAERPAAVRGLLRP